MTLVRKDLPPIAACIYLSLTRKKVIDKRSFIDFYWGSGGKISQ